MPGSEDNVDTWAHFDLDGEAPRLVMDIHDHNRDFPQEPDYPVPRPHSADLAGDNGETAQDEAWGSVRTAMLCYDEFNPKRILPGLWVRQSYEEGDEPQREEAENLVEEIASEAEVRFTTPTHENNGSTRSVVPSEDSETPIQQIHIEPYFGSRTPSPDSSQVPQA